MTYAGNGLHTYMRLFGPANIIAVGDSVQFHMDRQIREYS